MCWAQQGLQHLSVTSRALDRAPLHGCTLTAPSQHRECYRIPEMV